MLIWGTRVSLLQAFGYSIALGGLIYYKLGAEKLKAYFSEGGRAWTDYGFRHPARRWIIILGGIAVTFLLIFGGLAPHYAPQYDPTAYLANSRYLQPLIGDKATSGTT